MQPVGPSVLLKVVCAWPDAHNAGGCEMRDVRLQIWLSFALFITAMTTLSVPFNSQSQTTPPAPPAILLGTAWYPEQWPESRWDTDLGLMQQAGIRMVRI